MKKNKLFTCIALASTMAILATAAGCKKSNDNDAGGNGISATIGGAGWQSQQVVGLEPNNDSFIYLTGWYSKSAGDTSAIEISIPDSAHVNEPDNFISFDLDYFSSSNKRYTSDDNFGGHGIITVTSWDKTAHTIAGTFSGVFYNTQDSKDSLAFTNGHFNTSYLVQ